MAKANFENFHLYLKELYIQFSQTVDFASNFAEALSVVFAVEMLSDQSGDLKELETAMNIFQQLFEKTGSNHYLRKLEICRKMKSL
jgi:hypothetical protein